MHIRNTTITTNATKTTNTTRMGIAGGGDAGMAVMVADRTVKMAGIAVTKGASQSACQTITPPAAVITVFHTVTRVAVEMVAPAWAESIAAQVSSAHVANRAGNTATTGAARASRTGLTATISFSSRVRKRA